MSVLVDTTLGSFTVDLFTESAPIASRNFLKLCKLKAYHGTLFFNVQSGYIAQGGDPTGTGRGGASVFSLLHGAQASGGFEPEVRPHLRHSRRGTLSYVPGPDGRNGSQFLVTLRDKCPSLDDRYTIFGTIADEAWPASLAAIDAALCDDAGRPFVDVRIRHTHVLVDPFDDPRGLADLVPPASPLWTCPPSESVAPRLAPEEAAAIAAEAAAIASGRVLTAEELAGRKEARAAQDASSRAVLLEMVGDLPSADAKPPETALFVCKLNPITTSKDLETIFSRFGEISQCDIVRDDKTGASLCYGFVNFQTRAAAETAYLKMDNVLIDDRRIRVDFSQSVAGHWNAFARKRLSLGASSSANAAPPSVSRRAPIPHAAGGGANGSALMASVMSQIHSRLGAIAAASQSAALPPQMHAAVAPPGTSHIVRGSDDRREQGCDRRSRSRSRSRDRHRERRRHHERRSRSPARDDHRERRSRSRSHDRHRHHRRRHHRSRSRSATPHAPTR